jgi:two-component system NarL family sensor kinase
VTEGAREQGREVGEMSAHVAARLAWSTWGLSLVLTALSLLLLALNRSEPDVYLFDNWAEYALSAVTFSTVGAFVASRRPENPIGWIFCAIGLYSGVQHFAAEYATYTILTRPDSLPGGPALAWIYNWGYVVGIGLFVCLLLLFPDGRLVSRRWRWFAWLSVGVFMVATIWAMLQRGPMSGLGPIRNPLGIEVATGTLEDALDSVTGGLMAAVGLGAAVSLFVRLRHAEGGRAPADKVVRLRCRRVGMQRHLLHCLLRLSASKCALGIVGWPGTHPG